MAFSGLYGCLFFGCFVFQLANLSTGFNVVQSPRFLGIKSGATVFLYCKTDSPDAVEVKWWKSTENGKELYSNDSAAGIKESDRSTIHKFIITITTVKRADSGIYYCDIKVNNNTKNGSGTELKVHARIQPEEITSQNTMKDAIILIQGFLLLACWCVPFLLNLSKDDAESDNGELEEEHTYEGLEIEENENAYEGIVIVQRDGEAKWIYGEHPCQE